MCGTFVGGGACGHTGAGVDDGERAEVRNDASLVLVLVVAAAAAAALDDGEVDGDDDDDDSNNSD